MSTLLLLSRLRRLLAAPARIDGAALAYPVDVASIRAALDGAERRRHGA